MSGRKSIFTVLVTVLLVLQLLFAHFGAVVAAGGLPSCGPLVDFKVEGFSNPTRVDNPFYSLVPGTQFTMTGFSNLGGGALPHQVVFTVTDLVKVIDGVRTRVLWDTDINNGVLVESELAFQAQDNAGNVWVMGEYPEEYDAGVFTGAPSTWISGLAHAKGGVLVPGSPQLKSSAFMEGKAPTVGFYDCGQVFGMGEVICDSKKCYQNGLTVNEWDPTDPASGTQQKYYAPGVGNVKIGALNDPQGETLVLTGIRRLNAMGLSKVRAQALKLEKRAFEVSEVYRLTSPAEISP